LALHAGRIGERAEQIEDGALADRLPRLGHMAHGGVMGLGEEEDDADLAQSAFREGGLQIDRHPQSFQYVGGAACEDMERLPCLATGTPAAATTNDTAVEILSVPSPSPPVPQRSIARGGAGDGLHLRLERRDRAHEFRSGGLSCRQRDEEVLDLFLAGTAAQQLTKDARRFVLAQGMVLDAQGIEKPRLIASAPGNWRANAWPFSEAMLSGWNCTHVNRMALVHHALDSRRPRWWR